MKRKRNAKIVVTLGPASSDETIMRALVEAGADVFRFNFSHGTHQEHAERYYIIRKLEEEAGRPICVLQDLQGPKVRLGNLFDSEIVLQQGQNVVFVCESSSSDPAVIPFPHPEVFETVLPNQGMLIDDGKVRLRITSVRDDSIHAEVLVGGVISNRKGVNLPDTVLQLSPITEKDRNDLEFGLKLGIDYVALSFVQRPSDIIEARTLVGGDALIMTKIEKPSVFERIDDIIALSDSIMVARGDLGVEIPPEDVPGKQKELIHACRIAGKPVVIATQMLDSMVSSASPTRAEASDVATAIYDGADAVMLSAESAAGKYPVEAVSMMDRIITKTEAHRSYKSMIHSLKLHVDPTAQHAISAAAAAVSENIKAAGIVAYTMSGTTAYRIARERPDVPILGITPNPKVARQLAVLWGTHSILSSEGKNYDEMVEVARSLSLEHGFAQPNDQLVIVAGIPFGEPGSTNNLRILKV